MKGIPNFRQACRRVPALLLVLCLLGAAIQAPMEAHAADTALEQRLGALEKAVFAAEGDLPGSGRRVVFLSLSDSKSRATVLCGTGTTLADAWKAAADEARTYAAGAKNEMLWVKADVVTEAGKVGMSRLRSELKDTRNNFYRKGIALDDSFRTAFLEAELNANDLIRYDGGGISLQAVNAYLAENGRQALDSLPDAVTAFSARGWFCGQDGVARRLSDEEPTYGRRLVGKANDTVALQVVRSASSFLAGQVKEDGHFVYGYLPTSGNVLSHYNIVRHSGTIWSLICQYRLTGERELVDKIELAIECLVRDYVEYRTEDTAYVVERVSDEVKLGAGALAVIALTNYQEEFGSDKYQELAVALGNGILTMMNQETGKYYHVWSYPGYSKKAEFRTIYYDGEATFALARLYGATKDKRWLDAAEAALGNFIRNDYYRYADHWVSYAVNEVTKYAKKDDYFTLGLQNAGENLEGIYSRETTGHTQMELLMSAFELYDRMMQEGRKVAYLNEFDEKRFFETIFYRADYMLNGYGYPEYVMYFVAPQLAYGTFFMRQDDYRIRIDDVQHFVGGYYSYYVNYNQLVRYAKA